MLLHSDDAEVAMPDSAQWSVFGDEAESRNGEFLIESGAATSVCQQSLADSLGSKLSGLGTTICLHTRDGLNVSGDFQIAPKNSGLQRSIISVGQV